MNKPSPRFDPVEEDVEGWTVHVEPTLLEGVHADEGTTALASTP